MIIAYGTLETLWVKPGATVYVTPERYTHEFMEEDEILTII